MADHQEQKRVTALLRQLGVAPQRRRGQNFLVDQQVAERIVAAAPLSPADAVLEIGPGLGALTELLAGRASQLTALELEEPFVRYLRRKFAGREQINVLHTDALAFDYADFNQGGPYRLYANVPYQITTPLLKKLLLTGGNWQSMVLMLQKEAAERICGGPGRGNGPLAILAAYYGAADLCFTVGPRAFYPPPAVTSAVIRLTRHAAPPVAGEIRQILALAEAGFAARRKLLVNSLAASALGGGQDYWRCGLAACSLPENCRAEDLSLADFARLLTWFKQRE